MLRRVAVVVAVAAVIVGVGASSACFPQGQCAGSYRDYCGEGDTTCQGHIIPPNMWQTGPIDGAWLAYGAEETIDLHLRDAVTGQTLSGNLLFVYQAVSAVESPSTGGPFPAQNAGNLGEFGDPPHPISDVAIRNDTCANEFAYAVVVLDPTTASISGVGDAGSDGATDAADDGASTDGSTE